MQFLYLHLWNTATYKGDGVGDHTDSCAQSLAQGSFRSYRLSMKSWWTWWSLCCLQVTALISYRSVFASEATKLSKHNLLLLLIKLHWLNCVAIIRRWIKISMYSHDQSQCEIPGCSEAWSIATDAGFSHRSRPDQMRPVCLFGALITYLNSGDWTAWITGTHSKSCFYLCGAWWLLLHSSPVKTSSATGNMWRFHTERFITVLGKRYKCVYLFLAVVKWLL
jgi:hypothetical protein